MGQTTPDGLFTMTEVECLGACVNAPMLQVNNEDVYEDLSPENVVNVLEGLKRGDAKWGPQIDRNFSEGPQGRTSLTDPTIFTTDTRHYRDFAQAKKDWEAENVKK